MDYTLSINYVVSVTNLRYDLDIEAFKKQHCNHKCIMCKYRFVHAYEDDTPASYTPYHWWLGKCAKTNIDIESDVLPPDDCPFEQIEEGHSRFD